MPVETQNQNEATFHLKTAAIRAYRGQQHQGKEDERIVSYLPMVHKIVQQVTGYLHPPITVEDLVSAGTIGLIKAARDFDPSREAEFKTYAYIRIRGAVIDELRSWSFTPPEVGKQMKMVEQICMASIEQTGNVPSDEIIAEQMGISVDKLYKIFEGARAGHFLSMSGLTDEKPAFGELLAAKSPGPEDGLERVELARMLSAAITELPQKQRQIIILYYNQQLTMKQIAEVLGLTESRVSQLHAAAIAKLSVQLGAYHDG
jgi:RNA polymerase sigma factor for flagellar operon FliA